MGAHAGVRPRGIAQSGSAPALGAGCRGFESLYPDHLRLHGRVTAKGCGGDCPDLAESESAAGVTSVQSRFLDKQAPVAQRIEHQPSKLVVTGSIPVGRTRVDASCRCGRASQGIPTGADFLWRFLFYGGRSSAG